MKNILLILASLFLAAEISLSQVDFKQGTVFEMLCLAKEQNKIIMVDVMTDWCKWCIELDNKVYAKSEIYDFANTNQLNYKIDAEKGEGIAFAKRYKVQGFPTVLFLDSDGKEIDRIYGYVPLKDFKEMMTDYNKGINTYAYLQKEVEKNPKNVETSIKLADKYIMYGEDAKAKKLLNKIIELDPENNKGKTDDAKFRLAMYYSEKDKKGAALESFIKENSSSDQIRDAYSALAEYYYFDMNDQPTSDRLYKEAFGKFPNDEMLNSSLGQILNAQANAIADKKLTAEDSANGAAIDIYDSDYRMGLSLIDQALPYTKGSVNEGSSYYIQSRLYYRLREYPKALESINKALVIFDRKLYRDLKAAIEKQMAPVESME